MCDLFLDTPVYNAHGTAADALWAGVPVLTVAGRMLHQRVAASLVRRALSPMHAVTGCCVLAHARGRRLLC
jgi:predicted O-linked N-acetylglucosamine transferase (SPINDLY family)